MDQNNNNNNTFPNMMMSMNMHNMNNNMMGCSSQDNQQQQQQNNNKSQTKKPWSNMGQDTTLLGMARHLFGDNSNNNSYMNNAVLFPQFQQAPPSFPSSANTNAIDITGQVLAELSDDLFAPPGADETIDDDIFDIEPVPIREQQQHQQQQQMPQQVPQMLMMQHQPSSRHDRLSMLQDTLDQVLNMEEGFFNDLGVEASNEPMPVMVPSNHSNNNKRSLDFNGVFDTLQPQQQQQAQAVVEPMAKRQRTAAAVASPEDQNNNNQIDPATGRRFRPYQSEQWSEKFDELLIFKQQRGHCCVPHTFDENPSLARWVKRQRYQYKLLQENKPSTMTQERVVSLEQVGFVWDSHGAAWEERWNELADFCRLNGHANVPSNHCNAPLATWVKCQRRQYKLFWDGKASNMTLERIAKLERVGFEWELRASHKSKK